MRPKTIFLLAAAILLSACGAPGEIEVKEPWMRPTVLGENAAVYFLLYNNSQNADQLIGVSSNVSDRVEIHESKMENDVMQMNMVSSLPLEAGSEFIFEPGGLHVMLVGVDQELKPGEHIQVTLHFETHKDVNVDVPVADSAGGDDHSQ